jgi:hypothetical protein
MFEEKIKISGDLKWLKSRISSNYLLILLQL